MQHGQDDRVVYDRRRLEFEYSSKETYPPKIDYLFKWFDSIAKSANESKYYWMRYSSIVDREVPFKHGTVALNSLTYFFFAGKSFKAFEVTVSYKDTFTPSTKEFFYNEESLINLLDSLQLQLKPNDGLYSDIKREFKKKITIEPEWFIENKLSSAAYVMNRHKRTLIINPELKVFDFYRALDSYSAYQELDTWISGTLAWPQNFMVEVSDKSKVEKHGFDTKYGFRTRPKDF